MRKVRKDEKGVSPVIGVILMVAITVILAAVIATFVFGLGSKAPKSQMPPSIQVTRLNDTHVRVLVAGVPEEFTNLRAKYGNTTVGINASDVGDYDIIQIPRETYVTILCDIQGETVIAFEGVI